MRNIHMVRLKTVSIHPYVGDGVCSLLYKCSRIYERNERSQGTSVSRKV